MTDLLEVHSAQGIKGLLKLYSGGFGETHVIATGKAREDFAFFWSDNAKPPTAHVTVAWLCGKRGAKRGDLHAQHIPILKNLKY